MKLTAEQWSAVWERDKGWCIWPDTEPHRASEIAHFSSKGMGGAPSKNALGNMGLMCWDHARMSDGEYGSGGAVEYEEAHRLLGVSLEPRVGLAFRRAVRLTELVASRTMGRNNEEGE